MRDLAARLPYGVKVVCKDEQYNLMMLTADRKAVILKPFMSNYVAVPIDEVKPLLRPMEDMTQDEKDKYEFGLTHSSVVIDHEKHASRLLDWLNEHHFDYRGLIEKGLALNATDETYEFKQQQIKTTDNEHE